MWNRRLRSSSIALAMLVAIPAILAPAAPVLADCGSDGIQWPSRRSQVRHVAFVGTALERTASTPTRGPTVLFAVEQPLDGVIGPSVLLVPWCVGTPFVPGGRYLISSSDTVDLPGSEPTKDAELRFTDGHAVAWRIGPGDRVTLLDYGDDRDLRSAPAWLQRPTTVPEAIRAVVGSRTDVSPLQPSPRPTPTDAPGIVHQRLGETSPELLVGSIDLRRMIVSPGAVLPPTRFEGDWMMRVEQGSLEVTVVSGSAVIEGETGAQDRPLASGEGGTLWPGDVMGVGRSSVLTWRSAGSEAAQVLLSGVLDGRRDGIVTLGPEEAGDPFVGTVIRRVVLTGPGETGDRFRITVADRSGRLIGARIPTRRELRFAGGGDPAVDHRDLGIGPVAWLDEYVVELLVRWYGTPCGPVVTVDVARELAAIRVVDRTPGCDAAAAPRAVVLRFRGMPPRPVDIAGSWVRGR